MGKLIKNHWARLICLTAASCTVTVVLAQHPSRPLTSLFTDQIAAALEGFFWPKFFFDWLTKNFDGAVKPVPTLQTINLIFGLLGLAYEWPLKIVAGTAIHRSMEVRLMWIPLASLSSLLLYQATNAALYYFIGCMVYFWAYSEGEVICAVPWTLPKRADRRRAEKA
ncbi:hypothetical protein TI39_contig385g00009 [Zymoseptoria brevis]|uniref:DUF7727 domain-containing protein n=1 Tax=Zymoseptoria brevis TaxID=1047168 RepID=A0A0F4GNQ7_9PEZI|nr:hypothetical protein TI39_contig385g00009 [Zymoseptoria brevis]